MEIGVVCTVPFKLENGFSNTTTRIPFVVSNELNIPLIHSNQTAHEFRNVVFETLFVRTGPLVWCPYRDIVFDLVSHAKKVIFLQNDFAYREPSCLTNLCKEIVYWSSVREGAKRYIDWNRLSWNPITSLTPVNKVNGLFYYGSYRKGRIQYIKKYLENAPYPVVISTFGKKNISLFGSIAGNVRIMNPFDSIRQLRAFTLSLYIEDTYSHKTYCSPANRFYECLSARLPMVFDKSCLATFNAVGLDISDYVVDSPKDVSLKLHTSEVIAHRQRATWYREYYKDCISDLHELAKKEGLE